MRWKKTLTMVEAHAEGEVGRVVTGGVVDLPGASMAEKMHHLNHVDDRLRRFCVYEPRGAAQMSTNLLFPPTRPDADIGFIVLQGDQAHAMSGSNAICVTTVVLETGMIDMKEPETVVRLDTPAGLVIARATCRGGKCERVSLDMVPAYAEVLDKVVDVPGLGQVKVDIAFGGIFYALIDPRPLGLAIDPAQARQLVDIGSRIHRALNDTVPVSHPHNPALNGIAYTMFVDTRSDGTWVGSTVMPPGRLDRSPCGTGNTARMAVSYARGESQIGDRRTAHSIINSVFDVELKDLEQQDGANAVLVRVSGRGWIHGLHQIGVDPSDPYPNGYLVSDTWGDAFDLMRPVTGLSPSQGG